MNQIALSGMIAKEIKTQKSKNGTSFSANQIEVVREKNAKMSDYINFICFRDNALLLESSFKGAMIEISGTLQINTYKKKDGTYKREECVVVDKLQLLDVPMNEEGFVGEAIELDENGEDDLPF